MKELSHSRTSVLLATFLIANLAQTAFSQNTLLVTNKWSIEAGSRPYLSLANNWPRGIMINRTTSHVLIPTGTPAPQVNILSLADGSDLGTFNTNGLSGGHNGAGFALLQGGVADDGVIYIGNLEVNSTVFQIWRWSSESPSVVPVSVFGPADPGPTQTRIGDAFAVRGAGTHTQIIASGTDSPYFTVFTTADGANFTAHQFALPPEVAPGEARRGVPFDGTNDAFYAINVNSSTAHHIAFDLAAGTSTLLEDITLNGGQPVGCISVTTVGGRTLLAGVHDTSYDGSMHTLEVYDISHPAAVGIVPGGETLFPGTATRDGNGTAGTDFGLGMLVALNTHNGVLAQSISALAPTAIDVSSNLVLHLKFDGDLYDYSGRGNHGTNVGAAAFTSGQIGAHALEVSTDTGVPSYNYVTLGLRPDLQFSSNVSFSVSYWVKLPAGTQPGDLPFLCNAIGAGASPGYFFGPAYYTGGWRWTLFNADGSGGLRCPGPDNSINDGNWHHVAHTFDRAGVGLTYLDGLQVSSVSIASVGDLDTAQPTNIGQDPTGAYSESAQFDLDDMGVWRRVLTPFEVASIYAAGTGHSANLVSAPVRITARFVSGQVQLVWSGGILQSADRVNGSYTDLPYATSPYGVTASGLKFFRVRQ
jgi:hypothetical protein